MLRMPSTKSGMDWSSGLRMSSAKTARGRVEDAPEEGGGEERRDAPAEPAGRDELALVLEVLDLLEVAVRASGTRDRAPRASSRDQSSGTRREMSCSILYLRPM